MRASVCANSRLAGAGRANQQDIRLRELDVVVLGLVVETLVVIMDRDREHLLGVILADHVVVENLAYLLGSWDAIARLHQRGFILLADDVHAQLDAIVANEYGRTGDELVHLVLVLAAERAKEQFLGFAAADVAHLRTPQDTSHHSRNPQDQTRLTHDRGGQARAGTKGGRAPAASIIKEGSENP
jgi:hypothetical protein